MGNKLGTLFIQQSIAPLEYLKDKRIVIDGNLWIHKYCSVYRDKNGELYKSKAGIVTSHIFGMLNLLIRLKKICKQIIFVIESESVYNAHKANTLTKRRELKTKSIDQYNFLKSSNVDTEDPALKRLKLQSFSVTKEIYKSTEEFLTHFGIMTYKSKYEGELECAKMIQKGVADVCITDDWDIILYNVPVIRNLRLESNTLKAQFVNVSENLTRLGVSQQQLIDMCMLTGNDYFKGINKIGPITALKFLKEYKTLDNVMLAKGDKYDFSELKNTYASIINYLDLSINTDEINKIVIPKLNILGLKNFLINVCSFSDIKVIPILSQLNEENNL